MQGSTLAHDLRKVISLVDMLRDIGLDKYLSLPKVVVLGNQSSGKSSLIQQIVGLDFLPRGKGVVTRRPLQLRMNNKPNLQQPFAQFDEVTENGQKRKFTDFNKVRSTIQEVTQKVCFKSKDIKDIPIVLNIYSSSCPNLTIVDLPGITLIPVQGQPENIYQITKQMAIRYISQPRSIILCVIPANQDITNSQALHLMRRIDPHGERSIGCLTKIDIMNRGDDATKMLKNQQVPLKYGYVGVKNRCQEDIQNNIPVRESLKSQKQFFSKSPIYSRLPSQLFSTQSLTKKLSTILYQQIKHSIPQILLQIKNKKNKIGQELKKIGEGVVDSDQQLIKYSWKCVSCFMKIFKNSINGIKNAFYKENPVNYKIQEQLKNIYKQEYDEPATSNLNDKDIQKAVENYFGGSTMLNFPTIDAFLFLLNPLLRKLQGPALQANNKIHQLLNKQADYIVKQTMSEKFPDFNSKFRELVGNVLQRHKKQLDGYLGVLLESQISYLYTNDNNYLFGNYAMNEKEKRKIQSGKVKDSITFQLRKRIDSYFKLVVRNLRDLVPKQIINFMLIKCQNVLQFEAFQFINDTKRLKILLKEPVQIVNKRKQYKESLKILQKSQKSILLDPDIAKLIKQIKRQDKKYNISEQNQKNYNKLKTKQANQLSINQNKDKTQFTSPQQKKERKISDLQSLFGRNLIAHKNKKEDKLIDEKVEKIYKTMAQDETFSKLWDTKLNKQQNKSNQSQLTQTITNPRKQKLQERPTLPNNKSFNSIRRIFQK